MAEWHGLAKLRLHTEDTITALKEATTQLGAQFRVFAAETCAAFKTTELPRERAARARRKAKQADVSAPVEASASKEVGFNLATYKMHSVGDYPYFIEECGTTDAYSTMLVSFTVPVLVGADLRHRLRVLIPS